MSDVESAVSGTRPSPTSTARELYQQTLRSLIDDSKRTVMGIERNAATRQAAVAKITKAVARGAESVDTAETETRQNYAHHVELLRRLGIDGSPSLNAATAPSTLPSTEAAQRLTELALQMRVRSKRLQVLAVELAKLRDDRKAEVEAERREAEAEAAAERLAAARLDDVHKKLPIVGVVFVVGWALFVGIGRGALEAAFGVAIVTAISMALSYAIDCRWFIALLRGHAAYADTSRESPVYKTSPRFHLLFGGVLWGAGSILATFTAKSHSPASMVAGVFVCGCALFVGVSCWMRLRRNFPKQA